ncbi:MAG: hypothetical protein HN757_11115, partial [Calditrichaeota bacterium]|nr:hypothetical protein [Calditrichota bacterium]
MNIRVLLFLLLVLGASLIHAAQVELDGTRIFISGESNIQFDVEIALTGSDTMRVGQTYTLQLLNTNAVNLSDAQVFPNQGVLTILNDEIRFTPNSEIFTPGELTFSIDAIPQGAGGASTYLRVSGQDISQDDSSEELELHELQIDISEVRMRSGQSTWEEVSIQLTDAQGGGIFSSARSFVIGNTQIEFEINPNAPISGDGYSRDGGTYTLTSDLSGASVILSQPEAGSNSFQILPTTIESSSGYWTVATNGLSVTAATVASVGNLVLHNRGFSSLICEDELVPMSFTVIDDPVFPSLELDDTVELLLPNGSIWSWQTGGESISHATRDADSLTYSGQIASVGPDPVTDSAMRIRVNDVDTYEQSSVPLRSGELGFEISEERMVVGQGSSEAVDLTLRDIDSVGLFSPGRIFTIGFEEDVQVDFTTEGTLPNVE